MAMVVFGRVWVNSYTPLGLFDVLQTCGEVLHLSLLLYYMLQLRWDRLAVC
jgi:hypothetical protein